MPPYLKTFESSDLRLGRTSDNETSNVPLRKERKRHDGGCFQNQNANGDTVAHENPHEAPYAVIRFNIDTNSQSKKDATKTDPFDEAQDRTRLSPAEVNARLNLHLGQRWMGNEFERLRLLSKFLSKLFLSWWEPLLLAILYRIPDSVLRRVIFAAWELYLPIHKRLVWRSTGLDPSVSLECHALSTVLYLVHFLVTRASHIRYGLHILSAVRPTPPKASVEVIETTSLWNGQQYGIKGAFLHHEKSTGMTEYTIMWIYGGAFMSGDAHGNIGSADVLCQSCGMDVWIPDYRKAPKHTMDDILQDVTSSYQWIRNQRIKVGLDPSKIVLVGWSAGAALCTRLMQLSPDNEMPVTAVLLSPFVRYEPPDTESSMHHYSLHDWLVTRNIMQVAEAALTIDTFWGNENLQHSPLSHSMNELPPLCVIVSEHEAVYDETCHLVECAYRDHVALTMGVWKFMPHGWYMFGGLLPEGQRTLQFASRYIQEQCCHRP